MKRISPNNKLLATHFVQAWKGEPCVHYCIPKHIHESLIEGYRETLKTAIKDAIENQEQDNRDSFHKGREHAFNYSLDMLEKYLHMYTKVIAAAPELLEALQCLLNVCEVFQVLPKSAPEIKLAKSAIKKATK